MLYFARCYRSRALSALWLCGFVWNVSACDRVLGLNEYTQADSSQNENAAEDVWTIGLVSATSDHVDERQQGARMAIEVVNQAGGVPDGTGKAHRLALASATGASAEKSLKELTSQGSLSAVIGPDNPDSMLELISKGSVDAQLLTIGPNTRVDSIVEAEDAGLSWSLVPTDSLRMPLFARALSDLEATLTRTRNRGELRLSILYRNDAFGRGLRTALEGATWGDRELLHPDNLSGRVRIEPYDPQAPDHADLVDDQLSFAPDAIVVVGTGEVVSQIMEPLEQLWLTQAPPEYLLTDATKGPELLGLVAQRTDLVSRIHGVGAIPTDAAQPHYEQFQRDYVERFATDITQRVGIEAATTYDAVFAIAYALASVGAQPVSGPVLSQGMRRFAGGTLVVETGTAQLGAAFAALGRGESITASGTLGALRWDSRGGIAAGAVEVWCIVDAADPRYASTGLSFDVGQHAFRSLPSECAPSPTLPEQPTAAPPQGTPTNPVSGMSGSVPVVAGPGSPDAGAGTDTEPGTDTDTDRPQAPSYSLYVQYQANNTAPNDNSIGPFIRVLNTQDGPAVPLRELSLRYYLDNEHADRCPDGCVAEVSYAGKQPTGHEVEALSRFVPTNGTQGYLELTFPVDERTNLGAGESLEVQQHFHTMPYLPFDESNDYSFDPNARTFRESQRITAYVSNVLAWGFEPSP